MPGSIAAVAGEGARPLTRDGGLFKVVLKSRSSRKATPPVGSKVKVHYTGTLTDGTQFDSSRDRPGFFEFTLGVGQVIRGWDVGIGSMRKGEVATLTCRADYAYGSRGSPPTIPPHATLKFEVELFGWKEDQNRTLPSALVFFGLLLVAIALALSAKGQWRLAAACGALVVVVAAAAIFSARRRASTYIAKTLEQAASLKGLGGTAYADGEWLRALECFAEAAEAAEELLPDTSLAAGGSHREASAHETQARALLVSCLLNQASAALKLGRWDDAADCCTRVLEDEGGAHSAKALYRRAHARIELHEFAGAFGDLREASTLEPANREIRAMWARCKEAERAACKAQDDKERGMYARIFEEG